jgi:hypothetical protein
VRSHSHRNCTSDPSERLALLCLCTPPAHRTFQPWRLTDRLMVFAIRDGVLRCVDISACTSLQVRLIATTGRAVSKPRWGFAFRTRDCDARFLHACKCSTAHHAETCLCGVLKHPLGWHATIRAGPFAAAARMHTRHPAADARACFASLCPVANGPGWQPTSIIALGGWLGRTLPRGGRLRQARSTPAYRVGPQEGPFMGGRACACVVAS